MIWIEENMKIGLKMNMTKTKVMFNDKITTNEIWINGKTLEEVDEYIYLGEVLELKKRPWQWKKMMHNDRLDGIRYKKRRIKERNALNEMCLDVWVKNLAAN